MVDEMEKDCLFPQSGGFLHGGDYNPDQWLDRPDILKEDIRLMKLAGVNCVTLGVFSWVMYEPVEGEFSFRWLEEIMDRLYAEGIYVILSTPSAAHPAWLDAAYPTVRMVRADGERNRHGGRGNSCWSSPIYREKVGIIDRKLASRFGSHPGLLLWHISNEVGGECFCPLCGKRFREYLSRRFDHDIKKLNQAWWTPFWGHCYSDFTQVEPPFSNGETSIPGLLVEWKRFTTWNIMDFLKTEIRIFKELTPQIPVTMNFMSFSQKLDYRQAAKELSMVSWDSYPAFHNDWETLYDTMGKNAFYHALIRSLKPEKPYLLMECTPSVVHGMPYNKQKRPGVHRLACLQAIACGSDSVLYFQWRKNRGGCEQHHGAVVDHLGTDDTRTFREVSEVGSMLHRISAATGSMTGAEVALLLDWDNRWALNEGQLASRQTKNYEKTCMTIWKEFFRHGVEMNVVSTEADLSGYRVVVAPMMYMLRPGTAANLKGFVENGGLLLATYLTGYVDEHQLCYMGGFPGDGLSELFGVISEELDTLYPSDHNRIRFADGTEWAVSDYAEVLRVGSAEVLGVYAEDYYQDGAAVTCNPYGKGKAWYVAARVAPAQMWTLFEKMLEEAGLPVKSLPEGVEYHQRRGEKETYDFYLNWTTQTRDVPAAEGEDLLTGRRVPENTLRLEPYGAAVIRRAVPEE